MDVGLALLVSECTRKVPCTHCASYHAVKGKGSLSFSTIQDLLKELDDNNIELNSVSLTGGEPLFYNDSGLMS